MVMIMRIVNAPQGIELFSHYFLLDQNRSLLGRSKTNDLILPDPKCVISANHCAIEYEQGSYYLSDLSTNGTYVMRTQSTLGKGARLALEDRDRFKVGEYIFEVSSHDVNALMNNANANVQRLSQGASIMRPLEAPIQENKRTPTVTAQAMNVPEDLDRASIHSLRKDILSRMGVDTTSLSKDAIARAVNEYVDQAPIIVDGLMRLLRSRSSVKNDLRLEVTTVKGDANNPLKFSASPNEALEKMLVRPASGDLSLTPAVAEALDNIGDHQAALLAATKAGYRQMLEQLSPQHFENNEKAQGNGFLGAGRNKAKMWDAYCERFDEMLSDRDNKFHQLFGQAFITAYEKQVRELEAERERLKKM